MAAFFSRTDIAKRYREIGDYYDELYSSKENVWEEVAHRGAEFTRFMGGLVEALSPRHYLDVGCGEGFLLREASASKKFGTEISSTAIKVASRRAEAEFCRACAEELPYPDDCFDVVSSVGVTEHCVDDLAATAEAHRVLRPKGRYLVGLTLQGTTLSERIRIKADDFLYPRFRPIELVRWAITRFVRPDRKTRQAVIQPVMNFYTVEALQTLFDRGGFRIVDVITRRQRLELSAVFRIYVLEK